MEWIREALRAFSTSPYEARLHKPATVRFVGSEFLTDLVMKAVIFWEVKSVYKPTFRRNASPPSSGSKFSQARNQRVAGSYAMSKSHGV
jgi:hypothetical protein